MDVQAAIDGLFAGAPEEFVKERDALAKRLRGEGRTEEAAEVKRLRRPTVAAWAVNRVAHERSELLEPLVELARDLRRAQRGALSGLRGQALREAVRRRRTVVDRIADEAVALLEESGRSGDAQREAITRTLEAATADPEATETVRAGRLERELQRPTGFGSVAGLAPVPSADGDSDEPEEDAAPKSSPRRREDPKLRRLREQRDEAADRARAAAQAAVRAGERAVEADRGAEAAAEEADRLERDLRAARRRARESAEIATRGAAAVKKAEADAERARKRVEDLQARIERLLEG